MWTEWIKKEENGKFIKESARIAGIPFPTGYSNEYYKKIVEQTGDKYKVQTIE